MNNSDPFSGRKKYRFTEREDDGRINKDPNLGPRLGENVSSSILYFESEIEKFYLDIGAYEKKYQPHWRVVKVKPGQIQWFPHHYYRVSTRDGTTLCQIKWHRAGSIRGRLGI